MPVVIQELIIKGTIEPPPKNGTARASKKSSSVDQKDLIERCVEEVLTILERQKER